MAVIHKTEEEINNILDITDPELAKKYRIKLNPDTKRMAIYWLVGETWTHIVDFGSIITDAFTTTIPMGGLQFEHPNGVKYQMVRISPATAGRGKTGRSVVLGNYASRTYVVSNQDGAYHAYETGTTFVENKSGTTPVAKPTHEVTITPSKDCRAYSQTVTVGDNLADAVVRHAWTDSYGNILYETIEKTKWDATDDPDELRLHGANDISFPASGTMDLSFACPLPLAVGDNVKHIWEFKSLDGGSNSRELTCNSTTGETAGDVHFEELNVCEFLESLDGFRALNEEDDAPLTKTEILTGTTSLTTDVTMPAPKQKILDYNVLVETSDNQLRPTNDTGGYEYETFINQYNLLKINCYKDLVQDVPYRVLVTWEGTEEFFPLKCNAGGFDFSVNEGNPKWYFADGSVSTELRPDKSLSSTQTVYLTVDDFQSDSLEIKQNNTYGDYVGSLDDFPVLTNYIACNRTNVSGDISALSKMKNYANFCETNVYGDISALSNITYLIRFDDTGVYGDISVLSDISYYIHLGNTDVHGVLDPHPDLKYLLLGNTQMSTDDVDQTIINLNNNTTINDGMLDINGLKRSPASDDAIDSLIAKGWDVTDATTEESLLLECNPGTFDFSVNEGNPEWHFADGSVSMELHPTKELENPQTVKLVVDDFQSSTLEIKANDTERTYIGNLDDFPELTNYIDLSRTDAVGDISNLNSIKHFIELYATDVSGVLDPHPELDSLFLHYTGLTIEDVDQTIINLDNNTEINDGLLSIRGIARSEASTDAINSLIAKGWNVTDAATVVE